MENSKGNFSLGMKLLQNKKIFVYLHLQIGDGVVAQSVERRTENPCVTGSIPVDATEKITKRRNSENRFAFFSFSPSAWLFAEPPRGTVPAQEAPAAAAENETKGVPGPVVVGGKN